MVAALERLALFLSARRPAGAKAHDVREHALLCECGQVTFRRRRFELADGTRFFALDEALGLRAGTRVSPGAFSLVRDDALCRAYASAAELLCRHTRTKPSRRTVGSILRQAADALKRADPEEVWLLCAEGRLAEAIEEIDSDPGADGRAAELRGYLADNARLIGVPGPSLGTIEGDDATVYKKRLGGQRSWSHEGLAAMACLLSARASGMALPGRAPAKETLRRRRIAAAMGSGASLPAGQAVKSAGSGYESPSGHLVRTAFDDREFASWVVNGTVR